MNKQEFENQLMSASTLVSVADELEKKLEENTVTINERKIGSQASVRVVSDILNLMKLLRSKLLDGEMPLETRFQQVAGVVDSLTTWLENFPHSEREEITRMEATQDGMTRALASVRDTGNARLAALRELEAATQEPPKGPRKPGQRPVKISTVQHAKELRASLENEKVNVENSDEVNT